MQVIWTRSAVLDLHRVCAYVKQHNPTAAEKTGALIKVSVNGLAQFPEMGRIGEASGTRELVIRSLPYLVVYRLKDEAVQVLRVLHEKQQWPPRS